MRLKSVTKHIKSIKNIFQRKQLKLCAVQNLTILIVRVSEKKNSLK
jgi:hypothetical protein